MKKELCYWVIEKIMMLFFCLVFMVSVSEAAIWKNIPSPADAQKVKEGESRINNELAYISIYSTAAIFTASATFYKEKLVNLGWKLENELSQKDVGVLIFSQGNDSVIIQQQQIAGKNFISVVQTSRHAHFPNDEDCPECKENEEKLEKEIEAGLSSEDAAQAKEKIMDSFEEECSIGSSGMPEKDVPGKDLQFVPRYPNSVRIFNSEMDSGENVRVTYYTHDSVSKVEDFYRQFMGAESWKLFREVNLQNLPDKLSEIQKQLNLKGKTIFFRGPRGKCNISVIDQIINGQNVSVIGVKYNAK